MIQFRGSSINKQLRDLLLIDVCNVHKQWLRDVLPASLVDKCLSGNHARALLNKRFHCLHNISAPSNAQLDPEQQWLLSDINDQNELAKTIGLRICRPIIGEIVESHELLMLIEQLDEDVYSSVLTDCKLSAKGVSKTEFLRHLADKKLILFLTAVGISALLYTVDADDEFISLRIKFAFPKYSWSIRPELYELDIQALRSMLVDSVGSADQENTNV